MSLTHLEDDYDHFYNPRFEVQLGPLTIREADGLISGLTIKTDLEKTNHFSFTMNQPYDHEHGEFVTLADQPVVKGLPVLLRVGYGDTLRPLLVGRVESVEPNFPESGPPTVSVSGYDLTHQMTKGTQSRSWDRTTLGAVVTEVASSYGFDEVAVDLTPSVDLRFQKVFQHEMSDYEFLQRRFARRYGLEFFLQNGVFHFRTPDPLSAPIVSLGYGEGLRSFRPNQEDSEVTVGEVEVRDWDPVAREPVSVTAAVPNGGEDTDTRWVPVESKREAQRVAKALAFRQASGVSGQCETIGLPELREGSVVVLTGLGAKFSGPYYVERTTHRIDDGGYTTSFRATRPSVFEVISQP